ncbi:hypothetical protein [Roseovarius nanhaiticus]|uniref:hypothetical protein n=1 Tax=Roseovarius nanhaiticus TaxID=573024 RepID=UPI0024917DF0|nr:hypothetical protein [Roseovarius nanhaiticus]
MSVLKVWGWTALSGLALGLFGVSAMGAIAQTAPGVGADIVHYEDLSPTMQARVIKKIRMVDAARQFAAHPGIPSGFAAPRGALFFGVGGSTKTQESNADSVDGSLFAGLGLPTGSDAFDAHVIANITSTSSEDFGDSGSFALKLSHRRDHDFGTFALGLGVTGLAGWGDAERGDPAASLTGSWATHVVPEAAPAFPVIVSFGVGSDVTEDEKTGAFGGLGIGFTPNFSGSLGYNGRESVIGLSRVVPELDGLNLSMGINGALEDHPERRAIFTVSYTITDLF